MLPRLPALLPRAGYSESNTQKQAAPLARPPVNYPGEYVIPWKKKHAKSQNMRFHLSWHAKQNVRCPIVLTPGCQRAGIKIICLKSTVSEGCIKAHRALPFFTALFIQTVFDSDDGRDTCLSPRSRSSVGLGSHNRCSSWSERTARFLP